ncbi:protein of unknown function [Cyclobacterium xiamenense]|uniref:DUF4421 domain-containing protein n=1 Tax=Cyclobacterium xiamenense TaxID=1297121 RepID=A0A1H6WCM8_9BACT|nr:DUF4421 domain-containing protein [Cyclobacterium xiamenense]SEJ14781.1 protein of unknown function [Cyclobacterium xiamenense]
MKFFLLCVCVWMVSVHNSQGQQTKDDTLYYQTFPSKLVGRYYLSRKFSGMGLEKGGERLWYMPNSTLNTGFGLTYQNLTLNLAYGFGFINPERGRGETNYLDLQAHAYPKNWVIDLFGQFYNGYFLSGDNLQLADGEDRLFPDMKLRKVGASVQYLFNGDKFSYRAAFLQNEWQQRSAGSFLAGMEVYGGQVRNQYGILPTSLAREFDLRQVKFMEWSPTIGYAYSLVVKKHFFLTLSAASGFSVGRTSLHDATGAEERNWAVRPNYFLRGFTGYNSDRWSVNVNYVYNQVNLAPVAGHRIHVGTGNYRFNLIYRFAPGPKLAKKLDWIDRTKKKLFGR